MADEPPRWQVVERHLPDHAVRTLRDLELVSNLRRGEWWEVPDARYAFTFLAWQTLWADLHAQGRKRGEARQAAAVTLGVSESAMRNRLHRYDAWEPVCIDDPSKYSGGRNKSETPERRRE